MTEELVPCRPSSVICHLEVGCPIRKFSDQSLFAAPRDLSQRTTSFIASQRQGIRQIPFRHLIVLIIEKQDARMRDAGELPHPSSVLRRPSSDSKRPFCFEHIRDPWRSSREHDWLRGFRQQRTDNQVQIAICPPFSVVRVPVRPNVFPLHDVRYRRRRTDDREQMILRVARVAIRKAEDRRQRTDRPAGRPSPSN